MAMAATVAESRPPLRRTTAGLLKDATMADSMVKPGEETVRRGLVSWLEMLRKNGKYTANPN
jgi:hypothetical protein